MPYTIEFLPEAEDHLRLLTARERATVIAEILTHLRDQPALPTRWRKQLKPNILGGWELRAGGLRVYYDVESGPKPVVRVNAIGRKIRNHVFIAGEETDL